MTNFTANSILSVTRNLSAPVRLARKVWTRLLLWRDRRVQIASLRRIKSSDLRDIGLIEHDICAADQLPLSADVATALQIASLGRTGNW